MSQISFKFVWSNKFDDAAAPSKKFDAFDPTKKTTKKQKKTTHIWSNKSWQKKDKKRTERDISYLDGQVF